jgi:class 3 adenylate cyclase/tetratricopeptide (TPR) repeat protein
MEAPEIRDWLESLGLGQFARAFIEQQIDGEVLLDLTDPDLQSLGLPLGPRKRLLLAIAELRERGGLPRTDAPLRPFAERRNLTVLVCDLVDSTALATRLDPEELHAVLQFYMDAWTRAVIEFGGYVAKYQGDGLMAYFGYPRALEDAAERAVRTALRLVEAPGHAPATPRPRMRTRVGIATGLAIVGEPIVEGVAREESVVGESPTLASRLQSLAPPDGIVISRATRELLGNAFLLEPLGPIELKGFDRSQQVWRVAGEAHPESRFAAVHDGEAGALEGRDSELAILLARWRRAAQGDGQVVLLWGEPGLGKSRLVEALRERLAGGAQLVSLLQCAPHAQTSALRPVIEWVERAAGFLPDDGAAARRQKLAPLPGLTAEVEEVLAELLALAARTGTLGPQERRERTLASLTALLTHATPDRPRLLVVEDAHWSDAFTRELLERIVESAGARPLMLLVTARPEARLSWAGAATVTAITLDRLEPPHAARIVRRLGAERLSPELCARIVERAGGVPLFLEQLTRSLLEAGDRSVPVPATLQDVLMARLDRLRSAKAVAQLGAVLGREFEFRLLAACAGLDERRLRLALDELVMSGLALVHGEPPEAVYCFKHALVQDAAYHSMLRAERRRLHCEIARLVEQRFPQIAEIQPELVAHHYTEAGETEHAIAWWERASARAWAAAAAAESVQHLQAALALLATLPADAARAQREIKLRRMLVDPLVSLGGYSSPDTEANLDRLGPLLEDGPPSLEGVVLLYTQSAMRLLRSELDRAEQLAWRTLRIARRSEIPNTPMLGQRVLGYAALLRGDMARAEDWFTRSFREYDPAVNRSVWPASPHDPLASMMAQDMLLLVQQARLAEAARRGREAVAEAERLHSPTALCYVLVHVGLAALITGDAAAAEPVARRLSDLVERVTWLRGHAEVLNGWLLARTGALDAGLAQIRFGREVGRRILDRMWWPLFVLREAALLTEHGRADAALAAVDEAERMMTDLGQTYVLSDLHRQRARALVVVGAGAERVEAALAAALAAARRQGMRFYALRAASLLARRRLDAGQAAAAEALLIDALAPFAEEPDDPDLPGGIALREARAIARSAAASARPAPAAALD